MHVPQPFETEEAFRLDEIVRTAHQSVTTALAALTSAEVTVVGPSLLNYFDRLNGIKFDALDSLDDLVSEVSALELFMNLPKDKQTFFLANIAKSIESKDSDFEIALLDCADITQLPIHLFFFRLYEWQAHRSRQGDGDFH